MQINNDLKVTKNPIISIQYYSSGRFNKVLKKAVKSNNDDSTLETEKTVWNFLEEKGLNKYAIAGILGNMRIESGLIVNNLQGSYERKYGSDSVYTNNVDTGKYKNFVHDCAGYGLAQWTYHEKKKDLLNLARKKGKSIGDIDIQLEHLWKDMNKHYPKMLKKLESVKSVRAASDIFMLQYERPRNRSEKAKSNRASYGVEYLNKFHNGDYKKEEEIKYPAAKYLYEESLRRKIKIEEEN